MEEQEPSSKRLKPNNPEKLFTFQITQETLTPLKHSIASLCDSEFNPSGLGSFEVTPESGVVILVHNSQTQVIGYLSLDNDGLHNFHCKKPISDNYMINLNQVLQILLHDLDSDDIHIEVFLVDGSTKISFLFCGSAPPTEFLVDLQQMNVEYENKRFPLCKFFGVAMFPTKVLRQMIKQLEQIGSHQLVSVEITEALITIFVGLLHPWLIKCSHNEFFSEVRKYARERKQHAWFHLHHLKSLKKASYVAPCLRLYLLLEPSSNVLLRFKLGKLGDLLFMNSTIKLSNHRTTHKNRDCNTGTAAVASPSV